MSQDQQNLAYPEMEAAEKLATKYAKLVSTEPTIINIISQYYTLIKRGSAKISKDEKSNSRRDNSKNSTP